MLLENDMKLIFSIRLRSANANKSKDKTMILSDSPLSKIIKRIFHAKQPCKPTDDVNVTMGPVGLFFFWRPLGVIIESKFKVIIMGPIKSTTIEEKTIHCDIDKHY